MNKIVQSFTIGLRRRWSRGLSAALSALGTVWLLTEITTRVSSDLSYWLDRHGTSYVIAAALMAVASFVVSAYEQRQVSFLIPGRAEKITLKFGSIFNEDAN